MSNWAVKSLWRCISAWRALQLLVLVFILSSVFCRLSGLISSSLGRDDQDGIMRASGAFSFQSGQSSMCFSEVTRLLVLLQI